MFLKPYLHQKSLFVLLETFYFVCSFIVVIAQLFLFFENLTSIQSWHFFIMAATLIHYWHFTLIYIYISAVWQDNCNCLIKSNRLSTARFFTYVEASSMLILWQLLVQNVVIISKEVITLWNELKEMPTWKYQ